MGNICKDCKVVLDKINATDYLIKHSMNRCTKCNRKYQREWAKNNFKEHPELREKKNKLDKESYALHKEEKLAYKKKYKSKEGSKNMNKGKNYSCRKCGVVLTKENCNDYNYENFDFICRECLKKDKLVSENIIHRKIMADYLEVPIEALKGREVHHIDLNSKNNVIKNLLLATYKMHSRIHGKLSKGVRPIQKVYLAAPIDGVSEGTAQNWRTRAYDGLAQYAILSLVPGKETRGLLTSQEIVDLDTCMIENSDAILVNLNFLIDPSLGRGSGTLAELGMALALHKPIIAFVGGGLGTNKFIKGLCSHILPTLEEAIGVLVNINSSLNKPKKEFKNANL